MGNLLASVDPLSLTEAILTMAGAVVVFLLGMAFKAGGSNSIIQQHQRDITQHQKYIDELYGKVAAIEGKANEAKSTAEAASKAVTETLKRVGDQYDEMRTTFTEFRNEMGKLNDRLFEIIKDKK